MVERIVMNEYIHSLYYYKINLSITPNYVEVDSIMIHLYHLMNQIRVQHVQIIYVYMT